MSFGAFIADSKVQCTILSKEAVFTLFLWLCCDTCYLLLFVSAVAFLCVCVVCTHLSRHLSMCLAVQFIPPFPTACVVTDCILSFYLQTVNVFYYDESSQRFIGPSQRAEQEAAAAAETSRQREEEDKLRREKLMKALAEQKLKVL